MAKHWQLHIGNYIFKNTLHVGSSIVTNAPFEAVVDNGGSYAYVETGGLWEISVPSNPFCCEPKTALKK